MNSDTDSETFESADEEVIDEDLPKRIASTRDLLQQESSRDDSVKDKHVLKTHQETTSVQCETETVSEKITTTASDLNKIDDKFQKLDPITKNNKKVDIKSSSIKSQTTFKELNDPIVDNDATSGWDNDDWNDGMDEITNVTKIDDATTRLDKKGKPHNNNVDKWHEIQSCADSMNKLVIDTDNNENKNSLRESVSLTTKELNNTNNFDDSLDGWDNDDWGDENMNVTLKENTDINKKELMKCSSDNIDEEEDGWDCDNWGFDDMENEDNQKISSKSSQNKEERNFNDVLDRVVSKTDSKTNNWDWTTSWGGVVSLISSATDMVSQAIETGIGVPDPNQLARQQYEEKMQQKNKEIETTTDDVLPSPSLTSSKKTDDKPSVYLENILSGVTQIGNYVITGGLDTLEEIGKKTVTVFQENDPGLMNKRKLLLGHDSKNIDLSKILREAKEKTEENERNLKQIQKQLYKKQLHFETLFDDYHGVVHLEALEMLSKQSVLRLETLLAQLTGNAFNDVQETFDEVNELCELPEQKDDADGMYTSENLRLKLNSCVEDLGVPVDFTEILNCWTAAYNWLQDHDHEQSSQDTYEKGLRCLAQTSALAVNKMHKLAELLMVKEHHSTANESDSLVHLTTTLCWHLSGIANRFGSVLSKIETDEDTNSFITSIFLEGSNSTVYIQKAFQLFIPILQLGAA